MSWTTARILFVCALLGAPAAADPWEETVDRVARSVVSLRVSATRTFDTESAGASAATGFVVDAERGLILTNRHVVQPGPVTADAVFLNHEEVDVHAVYRDPIHDFGFFRFDPAKVSFMELAALPLRPAAARVGTEVRVIGNDAGEKLSILSGTLARLDRDAPRYGRGRYNDFNTFYFQAASSSSGGSSGSPVVDLRGQVLALNAGGRRESASSFFLPLDRVVRALEKLQAGQPVPRGTLQTTFGFEPYDELRRLGLQPGTERRLRSAHPDANGLLVAQHVVPGGPAAGVLEPGDILVAIGGRPATGFRTLEEVLDDAVGEPVALSVERGGEPLALEMRVGDLHAISPSSFLELGGAIAHPLSYQMARSYAVPVQGVFLASTGYVFSQARIPARVVVTAVDGVPVPDLAAFERAMASRAHGEELRVRFILPANPRSPAERVVRVDRRWFPMRLCVRDDVTGRWPCRDSELAPPPMPRAPVTARLEANGSKAARRLAHSLALVHFDVPFAVDGVQGRSFVGAGLVVDAEVGLVVTDRDTVPVTLGDATLSFGGSLKVPARVEAIHPAYNLALVSYDPALLGDTEVRSAELDAEPLVPGDAVWITELTPRHQLLSRETEVQRLDAPSIPIPRTPRFRETNVELIAVSETLGGVGGVLSDGKGRVRALWSSFSTDRSGQPGAFFAGLPAHVVRAWVEPLREDRALAWPSLGMELVFESLVDARARGLTNEQARRLEDHDPTSRRALVVRRLEHGSSAERGLQVGDVLLEADGQTVTRFREVERAARDGALELGIARGGVAQTVRVETVAIGADGADRAALWAGALIQRPPRILALQRGQPRSGVYVAGVWSGSPAERYRLRPTRRITHVDGTPVADLEAFLAASSGRSHGDAVRLRTVDLEGKVGVLTLDLDLEYWPTQELVRTDGAWARRAASTPVE